MPLLDYASPQAAPPRRRQALYHARFALLALYVALVAAAIGFYLWLGAEVLAMAIIALIFLGVQGAFLLGMPELRWPRPTRRKPMWLSIVTGAALAALLTFGLFATIASAANVWEKLTNAVGAYVFWIIAAAWMVWLFVFGVIFASQWFVGFTKLYKLLVAGTWLELLITIPVDVQVRKRTTCYCGEGTFFALILSSSVAIWSFGPGLALLFLTRRLQRDGYFALCRKCGSNLSGVVAPRCPTCQARIPRNARSTA